MKKLSILAALPLIALAGCDTSSTSANNAAANAADSANAAANSADAANATLADVNAAVPAEGNAVSGKPTGDEGAADTSGKPTGEADAAAGSKPTGNEQ
jgi:hypothetical protein